MYEEGGVGVFAGLLERKGEASCLFVFDLKSRVFRDGRLSKRGGSTRV
jgi:hypothetical protein